MLVSCASMFVRFGTLDGLARQNPARDAEDGQAPCPGVDRLIAAARANLACLQVAVDLRLEHAAAPKLIRRTPVRQVEGGYGRPAAGKAEQGEKEDDAHRPIIAAAKPADNPL